MTLDKHYTALNVKEIQSSVDFYKHLGFEAIENCGGIGDKWIMMKNGDIMLGLYQDMFPSNILTFNPKDARSIYRNLKSNNVKFDSEYKIDADSGPCNFMLKDPDGNQILIDQHE